MRRLAFEHGLDGPFVRVGTVGMGRIFWRDAAGREYGLQVVRYPEVVRDPRELLLLPEARTRRALPRSRDRRPD